MQRPARSACQMKNTTMRSPLLLLSCLLTIIVFPACHKTSSAGSGFTGNWQLIHITGGPAIDVVGVGRDQVSIMRLYPDSSWANFYNFRAAGKGYWSVRPNPAGNSPQLFISTDSLGVPL